ncbi:MAG: hypothetical protein HON47_01495 [Candidatus Diapherotrites archaeon]|jgi:hypothetical protein|uniref:Uncharacterized protein n=1 Tax=Candidatus Iainarchaeum sp. TaxID=3101447 RepID=A0A8T5GFB2_9ARCH|nr:hypothetical protein [Candidatus Diapherotrites archaeon]
MAIRGRGKSTTPGTMSPRPGRKRKGSRKAISAKLLGLKIEQALAKAPASYSNVKKLTWAKTQVAKEFRLKQNSR